MNIFILAAGEQHRYTGNSPKQLAKVFGESVILRTARLILEAGLSASVVTHNAHFADVCKLQQLYPKDRDTILHTLYSTRFNWNNRTIVLLGDVYYTQRAMNMILDDRSECTFFGNAGEIFALTFKDRYVHRYLTTLCDTTGSHMKLWTLYRYIENLALDKHVIVMHGNGKFRFIDDGTDDIDVVSDAGLIERRLMDTLRDVEYIREKIV